MGEPTNAQRGAQRGPRVRVSRGLATVVVATAGLFVVSAIFASSSTSKGALLSMLPFAAVLAIVALGQTLVVQQGGIDLSVPGAMSLRDRHRHALPRRRRLQAAAGDGASRWSSRSAPGSATAS